jgi:hypothetical protein
MAELENLQAVALYFNGSVDSASGMAKVSFKAAGSVACFDMTINEFDPELGHIHMADPGVNGPRIFDHSPLRVDPGRFLGCLPIEELGDNLSVEKNVTAILAEPEKHYFDYHLNGTMPNTSNRGQLFKN